MLLCGLSSGAKGGIGTTYNIMLPWFKEIYDLFLKGNMKGALEIQQKTDKVITAILKYSLIPAVKVILEYMGFEVGNASFPMTKYSDDEKNLIIRDVKAAGLEI